MIFLETLERLLTERLSYYFLELSLSILAKLLSKESIYSSAFWGSGATFFSELWFKSGCSDLLWGGIGGAIRELDDSFSESLLDLIDLILWDYEVDEVLLYWF